MITGKAKVAGVIGWPVAHSLSPQIHNIWLAHYGIDGAYVPFEVQPENFEAALRALPKLGMVGVNVTIPHKEAAFDEVLTLTHRAQRAGAVNTVIVQRDGSLLGDNTDGIGFIQNLKWRAPDFHLPSSRAMILGAGGAAMAIASALLDAGCPSMVLVNRNIGRAQTLAYALGGHIDVSSWKDAPQHLEGVELLVNTTSLGMFEQPEMDLDLTLLPKSAVVADVVYAPLETNLLAQARERGNRTVDGLGMLLHQARPAFEAWFGISPEVDDDLWGRIAPK